MAKHKEKNFHELKEEGWERMSKHDVPPGLPEGEDWWFRRVSPAASERTGAEWLEQEADALRFTLDVSLVIANQQSQRSERRAADYRRGLRIWSERERHLRQRGFNGCIRGQEERCLDKQVLWCRHCRELEGQSDG